VPKDIVFRVLEEMKELGFKMVSWTGGEPLLHPDLFDFCDYATQLGFHNMVVTSALITKMQAKRLSRIQGAVNIHIDTIDQETYNKLHKDPKTLGKRIRGYQYLLEAGFPPDNVIGCICLTEPAIERIEETVDWFLDDMGAKFINYEIYKPEGYGAFHRYLEPSLSGLKRAFDYRANKVGSEKIKRFGSSHGGIFCKTYLSMKSDGRICPCIYLADQSIGNIFEETLVEIFRKGLDELTCNYQIVGFCGNDCENRDICFGCRSNAYHYLKDVRASDPKCWLSPTNPEYIFRP
jgi:MoaA/NifB/PqqE/SkfB family radical SAM enzyme